MRELLEQAVLLAQTLREFFRDELPASDRTSQDHHALLGLCECPTSGPTGVGRVLGGELGEQAWRFFTCGVPRTCLAQMHLDVRVACEGFPHVAELARGVVGGTRHVDVVKEGIQRVRRVESGTDLQQGFVLSFFL